MEYYCIKTEITNNFLIKGKNGYLLIDTGMGKNYNMFINKIKPIVNDLTNIKYILITHHHSDHVSFLSKILEETRAKLIIHKKEVEFLANGENTLGQFDSRLIIKILRAIIQPFFNNTFTPVNIRPNDVILYGDDKNILDDLGIEGIILHTPGHTHGSLSVVTSDGNAYVGDCVMNMLLASPEPFVYEDIQEIYKSWEKLEKNGVKKVFPSHGNPISYKKILKKKKNKSI
jgi:glyoxylase-like metal-dependent hydrolase (beta-lactamase superfamily II)